MDFISSYLDYASGNEAPVIYHRWCAIAGLGAWLGRNYYINHGHFKVMPNIYSMLVGVSAARKTVPIKMIKKLLLEAGYTTIAADKTSKEKFLLDLAGDDTDLPIQDILEQNMWGDSGNTPKEVLIAADEFNTFIGEGNLEFISLLGVLWDYEGSYEYRLKNSRSIKIYEPTVTILGGNTPTNIATGFPPQTIGQGFFSRMLFIFSEPTGKRITWPKVPSQQEKENIIKILAEIKIKVIGQATFDSTALELIDLIYKIEPRNVDPRFSSYYSRRLTHLLKLSLIVSASRISTTITARDIMRANTYLVMAENVMPNALGEFGKARNSDITHRIYTLLQESSRPLEIRDIWRHVSNDLETMNDLIKILISLRESGKIMQAKSENSMPGYLAIDTKHTSVYNSFVDTYFLTKEEY